MTHDPSAPGATFALGDLCFLDFESRSSTPITAGTDRYSRDAEAVILCWAVGGERVSTEAVTRFPDRLKWSAMPTPLKRFFDQVYEGKGAFCAHNAGFDRAIWNNATDGFPYMEPWMMIDSRAQAAASGLPAALADAAKKAGGALKDDAGKHLIKLFCLPDSTGSPWTHSVEWQAFADYAARDVAAMRDLFLHTRQLPWAEWEHYWVSESINERGIGIDVPLVEAATRMAAEDAKRSAQELAELTGGAVTSVNQVQRLIVWLSSVLPAAGRVILVERIEEQDEDGNVTKPEKTALTRKHVERLLAYLESLGPLPAPLQAAQRALQIRLYGGSKTPAKFGRMAGSHVGGIIRHNYVFNGATQTGRFSSRGTQIHNLARDYLPYELDALDALLADEPYDAFAKVGDDAPVSRKLSLLIRPALVAQPGNAFVWGDWANIEARVAPWLANDPDADKILDVYRAVDDGTEKYDVYTRVAAEISGVTLEAVDKDIRQRGKVTSLACQFGGGANALINMAAAYRMHLGEDEAKAAVAGWREANPWAPRFWAGLWEAITEAISTPGVAFEAGLVTYIFLEDYLGGSLLCRLPSGRFLTYRRIRWEMIEERDEDTDEVVDVRRELMFSRDMGRVKLWPGLACENIVQATAACILRGTLVRLDAPAFDWMPVRLHTHDEVLVECGEAFTVNATEQLLREMERGFPWTVGLPIKADVTVGRFYSKNAESWGL